MRVRPGARSLGHSARTAGGGDFEADPAIDGFITSYDRIGGLADLDPSCTPACAHGSNEFVPRISVIVDDFSHFAASAQ
ncbi:MAG TPA: hypothetical protein VF998_03440, partial [Candidatus Limnocylindria bacterium]